MREKLLGELIGLARATEGNEYLLTPELAAVTAAALAADGGYQTHLEKVDACKRMLVPGCYQCAMPCGRTDGYDPARWQSLPPEDRALREQLQAAVRRLAAAWRGEAADVQELLYRGLYALGREDWNGEQLRRIMGQIEEKLE